VRISTVKYVKLHFFEAGLAGPNKIAVFGGQIGHPNKILKNLAMPDFVRTYWVKIRKFRPNILPGPESGLVTYYRGSYAQFA
jgi:hypothetical protein